MKKNEIDKFNSISLREMQKIMTNMMKDVHEICVKHDIPYCLAYGTLIGAIRHDGFIPWDDDMDIFMMRSDFLKFSAIAQSEFGDKYFLQTPETDLHFNLLHVPYKIRDNHSTFIEETSKKYHQGAYIDIFVLDDVCDEKHLSKVFKRCSMLSSLKMKIDFHQLAGWKKYFRIILQLIFKLIPARVIFKYTQKQADHLNKNPNSEYVQVGIEHMTKEKHKRMEIFPCKLHKFEDSEFYIPNDADIILRKFYGDYMKFPDEKDRIPHAIFYYDEKVF